MVFWGSRFELRGFVYSIKLRFPSHNRLYTHTFWHLTTDTPRYDLNISLAQTPLGPPNVYNCLSSVKIKLINGTNIILSLTISAHGLGK